MATTHLIIITFVLLIIMTSDTSDDECISNLIKWISGSIEIQWENILGRGVYTTNTVQSNDKLAAIPIYLLFTSTNAHKLLRSILPTHRKDAFIKDFCINKDWKFTEIGQKNVSIIISRICNTDFVRSEEIGQIRQ